MPFSRRLPAVILLGTMLGFAAAGLRGAEIRAVYRFDAPAVAVDDGGWTVLRFPDAVTSGTAGSPGYPFRGVRLLLPPGESVCSARIERRGWRLLEGRHQIRPRQRHVPGTGADAGGRLLVNEAAYGVDRWVSPPEPVFCTHFLRGHPIAVGAFSPLGYRPAAGEVGWFAEVEVVLNQQRAHRRRHP